MKIINDAYQRMKELIQPRCFEMQSDPAKFKTSVGNDFSLLRRQVPSFGV